MDQSEVSLRLTGGHLRTGKQGRQLGVSSRHLGTCDFPQEGRIGLFKLRGPPIPKMNEKRHTTVNMSGKADCKTFLGGGLLDQREGIKH